jgi:endonuclease YncB( thermonuclease family)
MIEPLLAATRRGEIMRIAVLLLSLLMSSPSWAKEVIVKDGDTIQLGDVAYRLAGVDAPEFDQPCLDDHAENWACGADARDQLVKLIAQREVRCKDLGEDKVYKNRRSGLCSIAGEPISLNQAVIRLGYGVSSDPTGKASFGGDADKAKDTKQGLWKGCFVTPADFRSHTTDAPLQGASCPGDKDRALRDALFPEELTMPEGCNIRAKLARRARVTGHVGIYHIPACQNYAMQPPPDRWFCSEDDARAAGYRKAYNCRGLSRRK